MKKKAVGQRGSWLATVDGQPLPCVHKHWWKQGIYHDKLARPGDRQCDALFAAIKNDNKVILTDGISTERTDGWIDIVRTGYIAVYEISDPMLDQEGLRFNFVKRLFDLE